MTGDMTIQAHCDDESQCMMDFDEFAMCFWEGGSCGFLGSRSDEILLVAKWVQQSCVKRCVLVRQLHLQTFAC